MGFNALHRGDVGIPLFKFSAKTHTIVRYGRRYGQSHFFSWPARYKIVQEQPAGTPQRGQTRRANLKARAPFPSRYLSSPVPQSIIASPLKTPLLVYRHFLGCCGCDWAALSRFRGILWYGGILNRVWW